MLNKKLLLNTGKKENTIKVILDTFLYSGYPDETDTIETTFSTTPNVIYGKFSLDIPVDENNELTITIKQCASGASMTWYRYVDIIGCEPISGSVYWTGYNWLISPPCREILTIVLEKTDENSIIRLSIPGSDDPTAIEPCGK